MKPRLTIVSTLHYIRLVYRSVLFVLLFIEYVFFRMNSRRFLEKGIEKQPLIFLLVWIVFVVEMILRFFPSKYESPGCQKQFKRNYLKTGRTDIKIPDNNSTILIALIWTVFNCIFGALHMLGILDEGIMFLLWAIAQKNCVCTRNSSGR